MTFAISAILFLATFVRSTLGFGEALIAVPLLALLMPVKVAAPIAALVSVTVAAVVVAQDWRRVQIRSAVWLIGATVFGIPVGLLLLTRVPESIVKGLLAIVIILFSLHALRNREQRLESERFAWIFGLAAGVLGGAYGMNGPPLAIYGSMRGWTPGEFRATLQGYFLPASAIGMAGYWMLGLWTPQVSRSYLLSLPAVVVAIVLGRLVNQRMSSAKFLLVIHIGLVAIGAVLLGQAFFTAR